MEVSPLSRLALKEVPYLEALQLRDYVLPKEMLGWETWRERAVRDFGIPPEYFDLPRKGTEKVPARNISGEYRYLEILTKFRLTAESAVSIDHETGEIRGIYESLTGVYEALRRNDEEAVIFFASRLPPRAKILIKGEIYDGEVTKTLPDQRPGGNIFFFRTGALRALSLHLFGNTKPLKKNGFYPAKWQMYTEEVEKGRKPLEVEKYKRSQIKEALLYLVSQGHMGAFSEARRRIYRDLNGLIPLGMISPDEFNIAVLESGSSEMFDAARKSINQNFDLTVRELIPQIPLEINPTHLPHVPKSLHTIFSGEYINAVEYGGNPYVYSYMAAYSEKLFQPSPVYLYYGYYTKRNPVGFYQIYSSFWGVTFAVPLSDIDIIRMSLRKADPVYFQSYAAWVIYFNRGNIDILVDILPMIRGGGPGKTFLEANIRADQHYFPLSAEITEELLYPESGASDAH